MAQPEFETQFNEKLAELMDQIETLPADQRERLTQLAHKTRERHDKLKATVDGLQESLDYLRVSVKYLVFDLEATRRENAYLRGIVEQRDTADEIDENDAFDHDLDQDYEAPGSV
ncbi:MAG: hypothetical protein AAF586_02670 [Planctomycetota bacterium]